YNGSVYILGGNYGELATGWADTQFAPLLDGGGIGNWTPTASLPSMRAGHTAFVANGFLYTIGGSNPSTDNSTDVLYAAINNDGTISDWTASAPLPVGRS